MSVGSVVREVAAQFGETARDTILGENFDKHVLELELILDALPPGGRVLDLGGGVGFNLLCLRRLSPESEFVLVDRLTEYTAANRMGAAAHALRLLENARIEVRAVDFWPDFDSGAPDGSFDVTTCFDVLEHLPGHPLRQLRELARITKPEGRVIIGAPNAVSLMKRVNLVLGTHPYIDFHDWTQESYFDHIREYTAPEYEALMRKSDLVVERTIKSLAVTRARARNRHYRRRRSLFSPVTLALWGIFAIESLVPPLRHTVYCIAKGARGQEGRG